MIQAEVPYFWFLTLCLRIQNLFFLPNRHRALPRISLQSTSTSFPTNKSCCCRTRIETGPPRWLRSRQRNDSTLLPSQYHSRRSHSSAFEQRSRHCRWFACRCQRSATPQIITYINEVMATIEKYFRIGHMGISVVEPSRGDIDTIISSLDEALQEVKEEKGLTV